MTGKLAILYTVSEGHDKTSSKFENSDRVNYTIERFKEIDKYNKFISTINDYEYNDILNLLLQSHVDEILTTFENSEDKKVWFVDSDTYVTKLSYKCIIECISILMTSVDNILNGFKYQYLLIRPPGHHCLNKGSGFCLINNVFILSQYALNRGFKRVMIVDYDYHHGNGTQNLVTGKLDRFFISIHAYGPEIYPGTGSVDENEENIINIPLEISSKTSKTLFDDETCYSLLKEKMDIVVTSFNPDLILISNGFDLHKADPVGGLSVNGSFYTNTTKLLKTYNTPLIYVLEGGYVPAVIFNCSKDIIDDLEN